MTAHTCINTATTLTGEPSPPCEACRDAYASFNSGKLANPLPGGPLDLARIEAWICHPYNCTTEIAKRVVLALVAELKARSSTSDLRERALRWLHGGDTGLSSKTIYRVMIRETCEHPSLPADSGDFGRCYRLLQTFPEWLPRLPEVAAAYPRWAPLVREWTLLCALYLRVDKLRRDDASPTPRKVADRAFQLELTRLLREGGGLR